jgi:hypothetical protein
VFWGAVQDITCAIVNHINIIISPKLAFIIRIVYGGAVLVFFEIFSYRATKVIAFYRRIFLYFDRRHSKKYPRNRLSDARFSPDWSFSVTNLTNSSIAGNLGGDTIFIISNDLK